MATPWVELPPLCDQLPFFGTKTCSPLRCGPTVWVYHLVLWILFLFAETNFSYPGLPSLLLRIVFG